MKIGTVDWARPFASAWRVIAFTLFVCATGQVWAAVVNPTVTKTGTSATISNAYAGNADHYKITLSSSTEYTITIPASGDFASGTGWRVAIDEIKMARHKDDGKELIANKLLIVTSEGEYISEPKEESATQDNGLANNSYTVTYDFTESPVLKVGTPARIKFLNSSDEEMAEIKYGSRDCGGATIFSSNLSHSTGADHVYLYEVSGTMVYTCTVASDGASSWDMDRPDSDSLLLWYDIAESASFDMGTVACKKAYLNVAEEATLSLSATSISATDGLYVVGAGTLSPQMAISSKVNIGTDATVSANSGATIYVSNFVGSGTIVFEGVCPATSEADHVAVSALNSAAWSGTLWMKNFDFSINSTSNARQLYPQYWGNANSKIKWTEVKGRFPENVALESEWVLENGSQSGTFALQRYAATAYTGTLVIPKISGTGKLWDNDAKSQDVRVGDVSSFTGEIFYTSGGRMALAVNTTTESAPSNENGVVQLIGDLICNFAINGTGTTPVKIKAKGGTVTLAKANNFSGGLTVLPGTLVKSTAPAYSGEYAGFGANNNVISIYTGGGIDIAKCGSVCYSVTVLDGEGVAGGDNPQDSVVVNTGSSTDNNTRLITAITLNADASIGGDRDISIIGSGFDATTFKLNGHTLTKKGNGRLYIVRGTESASGAYGTIVVEAGTLDINTGKNSNKATALPNVSFVITGGTLDVNTDFAFGSLNQTGGTISIASGKTATASDTSATSISLATLAGTGTLDLSGCTAVTTLNINAGAARAKSGWFSGTINYPSNIDTVNITLTEGDEETGSITFDQSSFGFSGSPTVNYQVLMKSGALVSGTYGAGTVTYTEPMARIGTTGYASLADAISAAAENATVVLLGSSSEDVTLNKTINFVETGTFSGTFTGNGKIILPQGVVAFKSGSASMWPEGWTGKVEIPVISDPGGGSLPIEFNNMGNEKSVVVLNGIGQNGATYPATSPVAPTLQIAGTVWFAGNTSADFTLNNVTGSGTLYLSRWWAGTNSKWCINVLTNFTGSIAAMYNYSDGQTLSNVELSIGTLALDSGTTVNIGDKLVNINNAAYSGGNFVDVGDIAVSIGGETTAYKLEKKSDGLYIAAVASATPTGGSETEYARLSDAKSALGSSAGTIKLLVDTDENITLAVDQTFNTNGKTYTGTVSPTGEHIELASVDGVYRAVDNSTNAWTSPVNGNWNDNTKWSNYVVPNTYTDVTFPAGTYTVAISSGEKCKAMEVNGDATIAYTGNSYTALNLYGNISGSGTLTLSKAGLWNQKGSELTIGCNFVAYGGPESGNNCYLGGNPFRFTNPVTISGAQGSFVKNEYVVLTFDDEVILQANAKLTANGANIVFCNSDIRLPSGGYLQPISGAMTITDDAITWPSAINISGFAIDAASGIVGSLLVENTTINATGDVQIGTGSTGSLTIGDGGVFKVGSSSEHKWLTLMTGSGNSEGNFITINEGGELEACVITFNNNSSPCPYAINFNGGKLKTYCGSDYNKELIHDTGIQVNVLAGGAKVEVPFGYEAKINPVVASAAVADGGLTKLGAGSLVVGSASYLPTYNGKTKVVSGALYLPSDYAANLDVTTQATDSDKDGYKKYVFVPAASFGDNNYDTIAEAIAAAVDAGGGTVTLRRDSEEAVTTLEAGVYFSDGGFNYTGSITAAASVTDSSVTTYYATLQEAIDAAGTITVTLLQDNGEETTIAPGRTLNIEKGSFTCNAPASTGSMPVQTSVDAGITTYMAPVASITTGGNTAYYADVNTAFGNFVTAIGSDDDATMSVLNPIDIAGYAVSFVGYGIYYSDGTLSKAVAATISATYGSLDAAVSYETDTTTITLLRNSSETVTLSGKTITLVESGSATFTGSFTGNGTLTLGAALKSPSADRWAAGWTGTVELKDITTPIADFNFAHYGNANSVVKANNVAVSVPDVAGEYGNVKEINLVNNGLVFGGSYRYDKAFTFSAKLTGSGKLRVGTPGGDSSHSTKANVAKFVFKGDLSEFRGDVDFNGLISYKAAIVFTDADDEIPTPTDWGQIIVTHDAILTTSGTLNGAGGFIIKGKIVVLSGGSMTTGGQNICGDGTISYFTSADPDKSIFTFGSSWTGTVEIPQHTEGRLNLNLFGKSGSTVKLDGMSAGWLRVGYTAVNPNLYLSGDFCPSAMNSNTAFSFQKVSGEGSMVFPDSTPKSISIAEIGVGYSGTITNNSSVDVSIGTIALASQPAVGSRLLKIGGRDVSVGGFTVNGVPTSIKWVRKTVGDIDGIYVVSGTIFSVY